MRPWILAVAAAVAAAAVVVPSVSAQSLAEVAARNKKKDGDKAKPKVYTEDDLRGRPATAGAMSQMEGGTDAVVAPGAVAASPAPGAAVAPGKSEDELKAEREAEWRQRVQQANSEALQLQTEIDRAQLVLNDITGPLYGGGRTALIERVEDGQRRLAATKKRIEDLQEEGRRARFRP